MRLLKMSEIRKMKKDILGQMAASNSFSPNHKLHLKHNFSFKRLKFIENKKTIQMVYKTCAGKIYKAGVSI